MIAYLKKPAVQLTLFFLAVASAGVFFFFQDGSHGNAPAAKPPAAGMGQAAAEKVTVTRRDLKGSETAESNRLEKLVLPPLKPEPPTIIKETPKPKEQEKPKPPVFPDLVQVRSQESIKPFKGEAPEVFAPRGTLIKAALVITLESGASGTPVLGMVTEDVYFQGKLIVPAGTQVQAAAGSASAKSPPTGGPGGGKGSGGRFRDRIEVNGAFTFVWADGSEYVINGIALDHEPLPDGTFALTDGSPGIRGRIIETDDYAELKLLVSEALQGYLRSQQTGFPSLLGIVPDRTTENASLGAGAGSASAYSNLLAKKIEKDMSYVQVPAGTSFYIYTTDVFEPELRSVGGLKQGNIAKSGIEMQRDSYSQVVGAALQSANDLKAQLEESRMVEGALKRQSLMDRARALIPADAASQGGASPYGSYPARNPATPANP